MKKVLNIGLIKEEIELPVSRYIFDYIPKDFSTINKIATKWAENIVKLLEIINLIIMNLLVLIK